MFLVDKGKNMTGKTMTTDHIRNNKITPMNLII